MQDLCSAIEQDSRADVSRPYPKCERCDVHVGDMGGALAVRCIIPGQQERHDMSPFPFPAAAQNPGHMFMKKKPLPSIASESTVSHFNPRYEELVNYFTEQAVSLLVSKYKFERNLTKQLGFISFPVTEALMDLFLGFKKVKGSHIRLSSKVDWSCLLHKLEDTQWAGKESRPVSQPMSLKASHCKASKHTAFHSGTTHHSTSQHSTESPSTLPKPATVVDQEVAAEPCLHTESLGPQLSTPQENSTAEEAVDMGESPSSENEEEETTASLGVRDPEPPQASRGGRGQPLSTQPWRPPTRSPKPH